MRVLIDIGCHAGAVYRHLYIEKTEESRRLMQTFGNYARSVDPDVFLRPICQQIDTKIGPEMNATIDDVRFLNEAAALRERGFTIIKIERPGFLGDGDATEIEIDEIEPDHVIGNENSLEDFAVSAIAVLRKLKGASQCED